MNNQTKKSLDIAVDALKKDGYMVMVIMLDQKPKAELDTGVEVLCSHTNDPTMLAAMLKETLQTLSSEQPLRGRKGKLIDLPCMSDCL